MEIDRISRLEEEVRALKERNLRVEGEKKWETSWARMFLIAVIMYISAAMVLVLIGVAEPLFAAAVPVVGFVLSTLSLPVISKWWMR